LISGTLLGKRGGLISEPSVNGATDEMVTVLGRIAEVADTLIAHCDWVAEEATATP
jgi:hypothetical protein